MNFSQITIHFMIFFFQIEKSRHFYRPKNAHSDKPSSVFQPIIYLCIASSCPFVSFHEAPLPKFGFHPCRVYLFSLFFSKDIVSVALYDLSTMPDGLGLRSVVSQATCIY